jgi:hypothetical protein
MVGMDIRIMLKEMFTVIITQAIQGITISIVRVPIDSNITQVITNKGIIQVMTELSTDNLKQAANLKELIILLQITVVPIILRLRLVVQMIIFVLRQAVHHKTTHLLDLTLAEVLWAVDLVQCDPQHPLLDLVLEEDKI